MRKVGLVPGFGSFDSRDPQPHLSDFSYSRRANMRLVRPPALLNFASFNCALRCIAKISFWSDNKMMLRGAACVYAGVCLHLRGHGRRIPTSSRSHAGSALRM